MSKGKIFPKELLDLTQYPEVMFMDVYGNGTQCWDQNKKREDNPFEVVFKAKYIRADLVVEKIQQARLEGHEAAIEFIGANR